MRDRKGWVFHRATSYEEAEEFDIRWYREMSPEMRLHCLYLLRYKRLDGPHPDIRDSGQARRIPADATTRT